jgi:hypothetical protein
MRRRGGDETYFATQLGLADIFGQPDLVVSLDEADPKRGGNQVFRCALHAFNHIVPIYDHLYVLCDGCVRPYVQGYKFSKSHKCQEKTDRCHSCP